MPLTAKYATSCGVCRAPISPGEQIVAMPSGSSGRWAHIACSQQSGAQQAAVQPAAPPARPAPDRAVDQPITSAINPAITPPITQANDSAQLAPGADLEVYTDGACSGNPGPGGWAWATRDGRQGSGGEPQTTNQRMEITAALQAVRSLDGGPLVVVSDSTYVVNCFRDRWWQGWISRGWLTSARKPVANRDLWEPFVELVRERGDVRFRWVKGHSGDPMNDLVDRLAVEAGQAARPVG